MYGAGPNAGAVAGQWKQTSNACAALEPLALVRTSEVVLDLTLLEHDQHSADTLRKAHTRGGGVQHGRRIRQLPLARAPGRAEPSGAPVTGTVLAPSGVGHRSRSGPCAPRSATPGAVVTTQNGRLRARPGGAPR